jgi:hypothetical protein
MIIQAKVVSLFDNLNAIEPDPKVPSFAGSAGWFERLYSSANILNKVKSRTLHFVGHVAQVKSKDVFRIFNGKPLPKGPL